MATVRLRFLFRKCGGSVPARFLKENETIISPSMSDGMKRSLKVLEKEK
jgi:hypothetical protein